MLHVNGNADSFLCSKVFMAQSRHRAIICISSQLSWYVSQVNHKFLNVKTLKESALPSSGIASQRVDGQLMLRSSSLQCLQFRNSWSKLCCLSANTERLSFHLAIGWGADSTSIYFIIFIPLAYRWAEVTVLTILAMCAGNMKALV